MERHSVEVKTDPSYRVEIGAGLLDSCGEMIAALPGNYRKVAVVSDETVDGLYGDRVCETLARSGFLVHRFVFPGGEEHKSMETVMQLVDFLVEQDFTRTDLVVALGGGIVGDVTGFAASICLRGIDFVQMPTTLLAAVDSSVGGKTGVNIPQGKNLVGTFYQPRLVICDTDTFDTLDEKLFADGMAEVIKYGCIWDRALFERLEAGYEKAALAGIVARCVQIKAEVVEEDERDMALRHILNFGHTLGHAIEKLSRFTITHGSAVAIGMCLAAAAGEKNGLTPAGTSARIEKLCASWKLPVSTEYGLDALCEACRGDKKSVGSNIRLVMLQELGEAFVHTISQSALPEFLRGAV